MWSSAKGEKNTQERRTVLLEKGFELFSSKGIEAIGMRDVTKVVGCGSTSAYRYFGSKAEFVVAVATWKWEQFQDSYRKLKPKASSEDMTAAEFFEFFLDSFLVLYRDNMAMLRFNQFFNVFVLSEHIDTNTLKPYQEMIGRFKERFHAMYMRAQQDKTLRTDEPEDRMFSRSLHLMLAAVTRYAVGLVYVPSDGFDAMEELRYLKELILEDYKIKQVAKKQRV